ncbi:MAG: hypothetical protein KF849_00835 [Rhizobiaceae bacterium]|nr:hypothetical protein [Rhizobiaceae bacterium]
MASAPKVRKFSATTDRQPPGRSRLNVVGEVETIAGNKQPKLSRAEPQGIVPTQLILDLTIVDTGGGGTDDVAFREVRYTEPAAPGQFTSVLIRWNGKAVITLDVGESHQPRASAPNRGAREAEKVSSEKPQRVLGVGQYEARWIQRSTLVELTAIGILPCMNYHAQLEPRPERVVPAMWDMVFYIQNVCLMALRPFRASVVVHDAANADRLIVRDAAGTHEVPIQPWIGAEPFVASAEAIDIDLHGVHARLPKVGERPHGCIVVPEGTLLPAIYYRVFGPAPLQACEAFRARNCERPEAKRLAPGGEVPWPLADSAHAN